MIVADKLLVEPFYDSSTGTLSYLLLDCVSLACVLIDSVLDYDPAAGRISTVNADRMIARVNALGAQVCWILETHVHADHLSAAAYLKQRVGGQIAIGRRITDVQQVFGKLFNEGPDFACDGGEFDRLLDDGAELAFGDLCVQALHTPGHTPACLSYVLRIEGQTLAFVGDTLFMPDYGTARCDFPGADARTLYRSISRLLALPADSLLFMCHDYCPQGREMRYLSTVAEQRAGNLHIHAGVDEDAFVELRTRRDAGLAMPRLMLPAVQVNMRNGQLPAPQDNGIRYLKIPLNQL